MKKTLTSLALGAALATFALIAVSAVIAAANGVFMTRPDAWTLHVRVAPHAVFDLNVPGLLRLATTPPALRLLDGAVRDTKLGRLHFRRAGRTLVVRCAPCRIDDRRLHTHAVTIDAAELRLTRHDPAVIDGVLTTAGVVIPFTARLNAKEIDIEWSLAPTRVATLYRVFGQAIPEAAADVEGQLSARGTLKLPAGTASTQVSLDGFAVSGLGTERLQANAFTFQCNGVARPVAGAGPQSWIAADKMGTLLPAAVLAAEDQRFHAHAGFDADEIALALEHTSAQGPAFAPSRGASTITQQLARTLFTGPDRTAVRKLRELLYAVEMEQTLGKPRIVELYLNTIDWGPGICGARAAARTYFGKTPAQLSALEAAWLASILRNPHSAYERQFAAGSPNVERAQQVLMQMWSLPRRVRVQQSRQTLSFAPAPAEAVTRHTRYASR